VRKSVAEKTLLVLRGVRAARAKKGGEVLIAQNWRRGTIVNGANNSQAPVGGKKVGWSMQSAGGKFRASSQQLGRTNYFRRTEKGGKFNTKHFGNH